MCARIYYSDNNWPHDGIYSKRINHINFICEAALSYDKKKELKLSCHWNWLHALVSEPKCMINVHRKLCVHKKMATLCHQYMNKNCTIIINNMALKTLASFYFEIKLLVQFVIYFEFGNDIWNITANVWLSIESIKLSQSNATKKFHIVI